MADIDEKKITFISDSDVSIPIRWQSAAQDIKWNNAIAMAVTIARTIDKMNLWDGYLDFIVRTGKFSVDVPSVVTAEITDDLIFDVQVPIDFTFSFDVPHGSVDVPVVATTAITEELGYEPLDVYAIDATTLYIEIANPIFSADANANIEAFEITAVFGSVRYTVHPTAVALNDVSSITLTVTDMSQVVGEVNILYKSEIGNIMQSVDGVALNSFNKAFTYAVTYSEGE